MYDYSNNNIIIATDGVLQESHDSVSTLTPRLSLPGALESTNDSLPSVTLLQQSTMAKSLPSVSIEQSSMSSSCCLVLSVVSLSFYVVMWGGGS